MIYNTGYVVDVLLKGMTDEVYAVVTPQIAKLVNDKEIDSFGVALARTWDENSYNVSDSYVIVTEYGVRLQYKTNSLTLSSNGIWLTTNSGKAYYNKVEIGSGSASTVTAVWG